MPYGFNDDKSKYDLTDLIDAELDATSENAIQNKTVKAAIDNAGKFYSIDTSDILYDALTTISQPTSYTAIENCYAIWQCYSGYSPSLNGVLLPPTDTRDGDSSWLLYCIPLKAGDILTAANYSRLKVFGLKS